MNYRKLGVRAKEAFSLDRLRPGPITCPACGTQVLQHELTREHHGVRCRAVWLTWGELRILGVPAGLLSHWVNRGKVRRRQREGLWVYSAFDAHLALHLLEKRRRRRRSNKARRLARARWRRPLPLAPRSAENLPAMLAQARACSWVYFIQAGDDGPIKIGVSRKPKRRIESLRTASPVELRLIAVIVGGEKEEQALHRRFSEDRTHGEWFRPSSDLLAFIAALPTTFAGLERKPRREAKPGRR
jgi:hypothetical protein